MNYSVSYFHQIQDMAELFNTFYPFRLVTRQEDPELADQLFAVLAQIEGEYSARTSAVRARSWP